MLFRSGQTVNMGKLFGELHTFVYSSKDNIQSLQDFPIEDHSGFLMGALWFLMSPSIIFLLLLQFETYIRIWRLKENY